MKEILERIEKGAQVACKIQKRLAIPIFVSILKEALQKNLFIICILSHTPISELIAELSKLGITQKDLKNIKFIDWYSWETERVISVENTPYGYRCARDPLNLNIALNKVLKTRKEREKIAIIEIIDKTWELFSAETVALILKFQNKLKKNNVSAIYPFSIIENPELFEAFSAHLKFTEHGGRVRAEFSDKNGNAVFNYRLKDGLLEPAGKPPSEPPKEIHRFHFMLCSNCGAFVSADAKQCPVCAAGLADYVEKTEEVHVEEKQKELEQGQGIFICSNCGAFVSEKSMRCEICGAILEEVGKKSKEK
ncbi:MAG: hypothetical protein ACP5LE_04860 [Thermoplasmata archaeon]